MLSYFRSNSKIFFCLAIISFILFFISRLDVPYRDPDPLSYMLIGRGLYQYGVMPYEFAFDHKPFLLYAIYGLLSYVDPRLYEQQVFSLILYFAAALVVYALYIRRAIRFYIVFIIMSVASFGIVSFTANSELVYILLDLLCLYFAVESRNKEANLVFSAIFAVAAVNTNYVCGFALVPTLIYIFFAHRGSIGEFVWRTVRYGIYGATIFAAFIALIYVMGTDLPSYFGKQWQFLSAYSDADGAPQLRFILKLFGFLAFALLPFLPVVRPIPQYRVVSYALVIFMVASVVSFLMSGKYYSHYTYMVSYPAVLIFILCGIGKSFGESAHVAVVSIVCVLYVGLFGAFVFQKKYSVDEFLKPYQHVKEVVGAEKVLPIRVSIVPIYYSWIYPFQPLTWDDHAYILYGAGEDAYFRDYLARSPKFVMTQHDWCSGRGKQWASCAILQDGYKRVIAYPGEGDLPGPGVVMVGYDLYALGK